MKQAIVTFFQRAFAPNTLLHGAYMAGLAAAASTIEPTVANGALPTVPQLKLALIATLSAGILYCIKNGLSGSSQISVTKTS